MSSSTQANSFDPNTTSFSWSLGDQINRVLPCQWLGYFEKSLLTLKETIAKTQTTATTSNTQMWTATPNYSCRSIAKGSKVLEVNCPFLSPSTQVSAAQKTPCQNKSRPHPPPAPPNQGWVNGAFLPFTGLHPWFGGMGVSCSILFCTTFRERCSRIASSAIKPQNPIDTEASETTGHPGSPFVPHTGFV